MTEREILRERRRLSLRWRSAGVGRTLKHLGSLLEDTESLLATCPGRVRSEDPGSAGENALVVATDRRLLVIVLNAFGCRARHWSIPYASLRGFILDGEGRSTRLRIESPSLRTSLRHLSPPQLPELVAAVRGRMQPHAA